MKVLATILFLIETFILLGIYAKLKDAHDTLKDIRAAITETNSRLGDLGDMTNRSQGTLYHIQHDICWMLDEVKSIHRRIPFILRHKIHRKH